ncbi:MAG TPA: hypothetical protein VFG12_03335, partial [Rhodopila sp.]|nr:hypothetical protein [Rhodopila sp.]
MSTPQPKAEAETEEGEAPSKGSKRKLILLAVPVVLLLAGAGLWFSGILPHMLGMDTAQSREAEAAKPVPPSYVDVPEMVANLNSGNRKPSYVKLSARVEVPNPTD